jgi:sigma-54 specific flagellar transcriptional regulator A
MTLNQAKKNSPFFPEIVGKSLAITEIKNWIHQVADTDENILILGEPGCGKKVVARYIHAVSKRQHMPFLTPNIDNIRSISENSFLFLDQICDMTLSMQIKFLRMLQEKKQSNIRIIATSNKNLEKELRLGNFKEDLYYRLQAASIHIPPLRERIEDLPELISSLSEKFNHPIRFSNEALKCLKSYSWPGNITELSNLIERLSLTYSDKEISLNNLPQASLRKNNFDKVVLANTSYAKSAEQSPAIGYLPTEGIDLKEVLVKMEINYIQQALSMTNGVVTHAAEKLKIRRTTLVEKMKKYQIFQNKKLSI